MPEEIFKPGEEILARAYIKDYEKVYKEAIENPEAFWARLARDLKWARPWKKYFSGSRHLPGGLLELNVILLRML